MINGRITEGDDHFVMETVIRHTADKKVLHLLIKVFKFQLSFAFFPKEMHQQRRLFFLIHLL